MNIKTNLKITKFFLDTTPNTIVVISENKQNTGNEEYSELRDRIDTFRFITRKDSKNKTTSYFNLDAYEKIFYSELNRLFTLIRELPEYTFYLTKIGKYKDDPYDIFNNIIEPKLISSLGQLANVVFLWNPDNNTEILKYWGFLDVNNKINLFEKTDPAVPFKHKFALKYFEVEAKDKFTGISLIQKNLDKYVIN